MTLIRSSVGRIPLEVRSEHLELRKTLSMTMRKVYSSCKEDLGSSPSLAANEIRLRAVFLFAARRVQLFGEKRRTDSKSF